VERVGTGHEGMGIGCQGAREGYGREWGGKMMWGN